jgi:hypothetical protein
MPIQSAILARRACALLLCLVLSACGGGDGGGTRILPAAIGPGTIAPVIPPTTDANCKP